MRLWDHGVPMKGRPLQGRPMQVWQTRREKRVGRPVPLVPAKQVRLEELRRLRGKHRECMDVK